MYCLVIILAFKFCNTKAITCIRQVDIGYHRITFGIYTFVVVYSADTEKNEYDVIERLHQCFFFFIYLLSHPPSRVLATTLINKNYT